MAEIFVEASKEDTVVIDWASSSCVSKIDRVDYNAFDMKHLIATLDAHLQIQSSALDTMNSNLDMFRADLFSTISDLSTAIGNLGFVLTQAMNNVAINAGD